MSKCVLRDIAFKYLYTVIEKSEEIVEEESRSGVFALGFLAVVLLALFVVSAVKVCIDQQQALAIEGDLSPFISAPLLQRDTTRYVHPKLVALEGWSRPEGPWHVALQIGHLESEKAPDELSAIRQNTGAQAGGVTEVALMAEIAELVKDDLESNGMTVTILPTTIPPNFYADVFLSLHADGSTDTSANGYKMASSWRDYTGKARDLVSALEESYGEVTGLVLDPNITRNMTGYYGFNWRRYEHSAHPMAVSAIVETGFLTNVNDRTFLTQNPGIAAKGIADGVKKFLDGEVL